MPSSFSNARLGIVVAKRLIPKAVWRNRLKRLARESFRVQVPPSCPVDIVVRCKRGILRSEQVKAKGALESLLLRVVACHTS
jgi:ribonuclease P protein component